MESKTEKITRNVSVSLTTEELLEHANELSKALTERERLENELASQRSAYKSRIDETTARIKKEQQLVQERREWRDMTCKRTLDYEAKRVTIIVEDTGEVIEDRKMFLSEMQVELDLNPPPLAAEDQEAVESPLEDKIPDELDQETLDAHLMPQGDGEALDEDEVEGV